MDENSTGTMADNMALIPRPRALQVMRRTERTLVVYNPISNEVETYEPTGPDAYSCPTCKRPFDNMVVPYDSLHAEHDEMGSSYFQMLQNTMRAPPLIDASTEQDQASARDDPLDRRTSRVEEAIDDETEQGNAPYEGIPAESFIPGYYKKFFSEEKVLGSGGNGVVMLVQHKIGAHSLGQYACKRIPVGNNRKWLSKIIKEAQLLTQLRHSHLVRYDYAWLEDAQVATFGPSVPCIYILQEYCDGRDLFQYVRDPPHHQGHLSPGFGDMMDYAAESPSSSSQLSAPLSQRSSQDHHFDEHSPSRWQKARQLTFEEISSFFKDIASGLAFLHQSDYIHRDMKPHNCLLRMPRNSRERVKVLLSDFGETQARNAVRESSGYTATLSYCAPEVLRARSDGSFENFTTASDVFSLGMILHFMCFADLPYKAVDISNEENEDVEILRAEITQWKGFHIDARARPDLPQKLFTYLRTLLSLNPDERPTAEMVYQGVKTEVNFGYTAAPGRSGSRPGSPIKSSSRHSSSSRLSSFEHALSARPGSSLRSTTSLDPIPRHSRETTPNSRPGTGTDEMDEKVASQPGTPKLSDSVPLLTNSPFNKTPPSQRGLLHRRFTVDQTETSPRRRSSALKLEDGVGDHREMPRMISQSGEAPPPRISRIKGLLNFAYYGMFFFHKLYSFTWCEPLLPRRNAALALLAMLALDGLAILRQEDLTRAFTGRGTGSSGTYGFFVGYMILSAVEFALSSWLYNAGLLCPTRAYGVEYDFEP